MTPEQESRFWVKTERAESGCLIWTAAKSKGYGRFTIGGGSGKLINAHQAAWEHVNGPLPEGMVLDHQCHNEDYSCQGGFGCPHRACVEVSHLRVSTRGDNIRAHYVRITHCPKGHPYDESNTHFTRKGHRHCRRCSNDRTNAAKRRNKTHCPKGHPYDDANTRIRKDGRRMCLVCAREQAQRMRQAVALRN